jgi:hypothetical protein
MEADIALTTRFFQALGEIETYQYNVAGEAAVAS